MIHPLLFLAGCEILEANGTHAAQIVNICARHGISYRIIGFYGDRVRLRLTPIRFLRLRTLCEERGIEIFTVDRRGVHVVLERLIMRPGLLAGLALCVFIAVMSGRAVWDVRVVGNGEVPAERIVATLGECGIGVGTRIKGLELDKIENRFLILSDDISWITVNITGTVAEVEVRERLCAEETPDFAASNLIAKQNGTVVGFEEVSGNISVELGEDVSKGELLVGGVYGSENSATRFVRARGKVFALCKRDFCISVPFKFEQKVYSGEQKIKKSLIFFEKEVKFSKNSGNSYTSCDTIDRVKYFNPFGLGELPIGIRTVRYVEYRTAVATRTEEQAKAEAIFELWESFYGEAPEAELTGKKIECRTEGDSLVLSATVESIENIAEEREIKLDILSAAEPTERTEKRGRMDKYTKTVRVEDSELTSKLFGSFDANVNFLEKSFNVRISNRSGDEYDAVVIEGGERENVDNAAEAVKYLKNIAKQSEALTEQQVSYVTEMLKEGGGEALSAFDEACICVTTRGKPIKAKTVGQKKYVEAIEKNTVVFGIGPAGTGKTFLAVAMAVKALREKQVSRIILTRPAIEAGEKLGFLPGDLQSKIDPYLRPLYDAMYEMLGAENYKGQVEKGTIEIAPLAYMRGRTLDDCFIILDEAQNATPEQMKMFLTRLGFNSKAVVTGDLTQTDLPTGQKSGLATAVRILADVEDIYVHAFTDKDVVRHKLVQRIIRAYEKYERSVAEKQQKTNSRRGTEK